MNSFYRLFFFLVPGILILLTPFSRKVRHFLAGRELLFSKVANFRDSYSGKLAWFHVASLGEYEQARPVIAALKSRMSDLGVVVSFFSPSGYDNVVKKPQPHVDFITYLPLDRKSWADKFVGILRPDLTFFVKYDLWFHHIQAVKNQRRPIFLIAASLRENHNFFGIFGSFFRQNLTAMDWIFTQNQKSLQLLRSINYSDASWAGDTRFDRVAATAAAPKALPELKVWLQDIPAVIVGSAWEEDMNRLIPLINSSPNYRWIIAPHDLSPGPMDRWISKIRLPATKFSARDFSDTHSVLFVDNIGMLSSLYQFARVAYVGGGFGKGLHNILEPLGFGKPVIFGKVKNTSRFPEAAQSVSEGCGFSVTDEKSLREIFEKLEQADFYSKSANSAKKWVKSNLGAADRIVEKVTQISFKNER